jgi:tetratricopeptide (TPR) repeat protein
VGSAAIRYRAFLSYSHRDSAWSKWLQRGLERFPIDRDLVGRETPRGSVPKTLRPIFRDREDFSGGPRLPKTTVAALDASAALLVLCSLASAKRPSVNEEVRQFRSRHPDRPVIPIIVDDAMPQNLPPALRYELAPDGTVTDRPVTVLGPDLRDSGDGKRLGLAKVIAGLTGIGTDEILRRAEQARGHRQRFWATFAGLFLLFAVAVGGSAAFAWQQLKTNEALLDATLKHATEIVSGTAVRAKKYNVPRPAILVLLGRAESLFSTLAQHGRPTPELRYRRSWMLIQFARNYRILGDADKQYARATRAYRLLAGLGGRPDDTTYRHDLSVAYGEIGDLLDQGNGTEALKSYRDGLAVMEQLVKADPTNAGWQRELSRSYSKVGDVLMAQGKSTEALKFYRADLTVRGQLAHADPANVSWQRDLSASFDRIGEVLVNQGNRSEALKSYREGLAVREQLVKADPTNAASLRDLSVAHIKIGDLLVAEGNLGDALQFYRDGLAIRERLTKADPNNARWQLDLSMAFDRIGDLLVAENNLGEALQAYRESLVMRERLTKADPANTSSLRDLSVSWNKIGNLLVAQGKLDEALIFFRDGLALREQLTKTDPTNAGWQRDLWVSYNKIGDVLADQGNLPEALKSFRYGLAVGERLAKADPANATWQRDLSMSYNKIGAMLAAQGDLDQALKSFRDGVAVGERLAKADTTDAAWQRRRSMAYNKIGEMLVAQGKLDEALNAYRDGLAITERLAAADRSDIEQQRNLRSSIEMIGDLAYTFILAHNFAKALEAADLVISASPGTILLHTYRARALMFLGRVDEARALYVRYRNEKNVQNGKSWETLVLEDFARLRKAGLSHPLMGEIEQRLRAGR